MKIVQKIQLKIVIFTAVKNRCVLHGRVFVLAMHVILDVHVYPETFYKSNTVETCLNDAVESIAKSAF